MTSQDAFPKRVQSVGFAFEQDVASTKKEGGCCPFVNAVFMTFFFACKEKRDLLMLLPFAGCSKDPLGSNRDRKAWQVLNREGTQTHILSQGSCRAPACSTLSCSVGHKQRLLPDPDHTPARPPVTALCVAFCCRPRLLWVSCGPWPLWLLLCAFLLRAVPCFSLSNSTNDGR